MSRVLIFEGPDAAGKDAIRRVLDTRTAYVNTCVTRFGVSQLVYAKYFRRPLWEDVKERKAYVAMIRKFLREIEPLYVHITADQDTINKRLVTRGEDPAREKPVDVIERVYGEIYELIGFPRWQLLFLDNSGEHELSKMADVIEARLRTIAKER